MERPHYQAFAAVHWTMRIEPAKPGWLDDRFHHEFREALLHVCVREELVCPTYCLMPDHLHLMLLGLAVASDQLNAIKFLRLHLNRLLACEPLQKFAALSRAQPQGKWRLQSQAHDHVLREEERKQGAFASVCFYILANPVRAGLMEKESAWEFCGAVVPGYPDFHPLAEDYWELFWKIYYKEREPIPTEPLKNP
jgi:REP element-mobilizing transposase RayT